MLTFSNPDLLPLTDEERLIAYWISQVICEDAKSEEQEFMYVSMMAFNCLTDSWAEKRSPKAKPIVHTGNSWCKAPPEWFGHELSQHIRPNGKRLEVDIKTLRKAFGSFSVKLFETYYSHVLPRIDSLLDAYLRGAANRSTDLDLLVKLQVFTPFLEVLYKEDVNAHFVKEIHAQACKLANKIDALPCPSYKWQAEIELGDFVVLSGASALYFFEREFNPAFA